MRDKPVIDAIGPTRHRDDNTIGRNRCAGIEIGRTVIMQIDVVDAVVMPMMPDVDVGIGGKGRR